MTQMTCCFFGHREIKETEELKQQLYSVIESLILLENVSKFLFGSKSQFNSLCHEQVTKLKEKYPHIKRIYVRAEFPQIDESYKAYLLESYEDTYFPQRIEKAGKAVYVERNCEMINNSQFCVVYYHADSLPPKRQSGTALALDYAIKKEKTVIQLPLSADIGL